MDTRNKSLLDFQDPGMMPKELMDMPGFVNGLKNYTLAASLANYITKKMLYEAQFNIAEGRFDRLKKRVLAIMMKNHVEIDRAQLLRCMHIDTNNLQKIIMTLHACDLIEEELLSRRKIVYTLKNAG